MPLVRRNQAMLSRKEKEQYVQTVLKLKERGVYDNYITEHAEIAYYGHGGPSFLPWHREFLRRFELDLQSVNPAITLPYWDWTVDNSPNSSIWGDDFMGGNGRPGDNVVTTGEFAGAKDHWKCLRLGIEADELTRQFGVHIDSLPSAQDVSDCLGVTPYDSPPWDGSSDPSFRNYLEGGIGPNIHNRVHQWVGGHMLPLSSPNDPVFFLHHANTDRLWAEWQYNQDLPYEPQGNGPEGQNPDDSMIPWGGATTVGSVLDHRGLDYLYDTEGPVAEGDRMLPGDVLNPGDSLEYRDGKLLLYTFGYTLQGALVLADVRNRRLLWSSGPLPGAPGRLIMQPDGDLVVYDDEGNRRWSSQTAGNPGSRCYVTFHGKAVIYSAGIPERDIWEEPKG
ncbi:tyrosinase family protein [Kitasatospora sp. NPDC057223]|uniref:tyrosinase family protein n=1 Tax=Kitasatospora sp. NPDC057223 TaxID=3346055 RepID=UPI0036401DF2